MAYSRRTFVKQGVAGGIGLLTFIVAGCEQKMTPAEAHAAAVPFRTLDAAQVRTLEALGEVLLPGSAAAGLAHFIDHQLSGPPADSMLMIRYLGVAAPFADFYQSGLAGTQAAAQKQFAKSFTELAPEEARALVAGMAKGDAAGWSGPPAALFFFVLRNDAVDATYGTTSGFEQLSVPYMAHIAPPTRWGA
jgi:Gluconate 2-dehydrogenase subunit 3